MRFEAILQAAEAVSLALTAPTIFGACAVLWVWLPKCVRKGKPSTPTDWLLLGVTVSFAGSSIDNAFWGLAWSDAYFLDSDPGTFLFSIGALFNIFARQLAGCIGAYAHLRAYCAGGTDEENRRGVRQLNRWSFASFVAGVLYVVGLQMMV